MLQARNPNEAVLKIESIMNNIGLETRLSNLGIKSEDDIEFIIEHGFNPERIKNNPRIVTKNAMRNILYSIF